MRHEPEYEDLPELHPTVVASDQIVAAMQHVDVHPDSLIRWPFEDVDELTGPLGPGEVWFVAAYSGGGKTTFVVSAIEAWRQAGKKIYVMPLELEAHRFRTYLACMQTGVHPGDALSRRLRGLPDGDIKRAALKDALRSQLQPGYLDHVMVSEQRSINVKGLGDGLKEAMSFGADVVIVDHIDHISGGDGSNGYADSKAVNHAALRMAQDNGLLLVFTSQLNMEIGKGKDHLAKYLPPQPHHLLFPSTKLHIATGMIGLYRPIRARRPDEAEDAFKEAIQRARMGTADAPDALEPNTMGVTAMKLRNYGQHEGRKIKLSVQKGRVTNMAERDRYTTAVMGGARP